jgi:hypothetical protein
MESTFINIINSSLVNAYSEISKLDLNILNIDGMSGKKDEAFFK